MKTRYLRLASLILTSMTRGIQPDAQPPGGTAKSRLRLLYSRVKAARSKQ